jgi:beta-lactamase class C
VSLLNLGTNTSGGLPLQFPGEVTNGTRLMEYFKSWKPDYVPGTYRTYSNPSIGMLGMITAQSMGEDFASLMQSRIFAALELDSTYYNVPEVERKNYAQGYTHQDKAIRMAPGVLASEAYGIRTTVKDMVRFVEANLGMLDLDEKVQRAITDTHTGYFRIGPMTQDLIWEQYSYPVELKDLLAGNSAKMSREANPVIVLDPPLPPQKNVWINKTGSTNGFAAYVAFIPKKTLGIVLLANKNYPIDARVTAAHQILSLLDKNNIANK